MKVNMIFRERCLNNFFLLFMLIMIPGVVKSQNDFDTYSEKGNNELAANNYAKAVSYFEKALEFRKGVDTTDIVWTASIAGIAARQIPDTGKAVHFFKISLEHGCTDGDIYNQFFQLVEEEDTVNREFGLRAARNNLDDQYEKYSKELLNFYVRHKMPEKTIRIADELLRSDPEHFNINYIKASALLRTGQEAEAVPILHRLKEKDPENLNVNFQLGVYYYNRASEKFDSAKEKYNRLNDPSISDYAAYVEQTKSARPDYKKAIPLLEKVYEKQPDENLKRMIDKARKRIN